MNSRIYPAEVIQEEFTVENVRQVYMTLLEERIRQGMEDFLHIMAVEPRFLDELLQEPRQPVNWAREGF